MALGTNWPFEINATFYSRQSPKSWAAWADTVPDDFQFAVKASRYCVTRPKLAEAGEGISNFYAQGLSALGPNGVFVNIGRGSTVDEAALAIALADGTIMASPAAVDGALFIRTEQALYRIEERQAVDASAAGK